MSVAPCSVVMKCHTSSSCFSFTRSFISKMVSLRGLSRTVQLNGLNRRVMLGDPGTFRAVCFRGCRGMSTRVCCVGGTRHRHRTEQRCEEHGGRDTSVRRLFVLSVVERNVRGNSAHLFE